jgi:hypothetical protein
MPKGLSEGEKIRFTAIYLFAFVTCVYFISLSTFFAIDQYISRYEVAKSIVERIDLSIPEGSEGVTGIDGKTYSLYGLGWPILAVPLYMIGKFFGHYSFTNVFLLNPMAGAATVTLVFLFSIALGYFFHRSRILQAVIACRGNFLWIWDICMAYGQASV